MQALTPEDRKYLDTLRNTWLELIPRDPVASCPSIRLEMSVTRK